MKVRFVATVILLLLLCAILCGCSTTFNFPLGGVQTENQSAKTFRLYICGAVEREGYYEVSAGCAYDTAIQLAGLLPVSVLPSYSASTVDGSFSEIVVNYNDGESVRDCINVNSVLITGRFPIDGISYSIINKLADYQVEHGKISNRQQLAEALGDDYADNYYKFFVEEADYEEAD